MPPGVLRRSSISEDTHISEKHSVQRQRHACGAPPHNLGRRNGCRPYRLNTWPDIGPLLWGAFVVGSSGRAGVPARPALLRASLFPYFAVPPLFLYSAAASARTLVGTMSSHVTDSPFSSR